MLFSIESEGNNKYCGLKENEVKFINAFLSGDIRHYKTSGNSYFFEFVDGVYSYEFYFSCCDLWILQEYVNGEKNHYSTTSREFINFIRLVTN